LSSALIYFCCRRPDRAGVGARTSVRRWPASRKRFDSSLNLVVSGRDTPHGCFRTRRTDEDRIAGAVGFGLAPSATPK